MESLWKEADLPIGPELTGTQVPCSQDSSVILWERIQRQQCTELLATMPTNTTFLLCNTCDPLRWNFIYK